MHSLNTIRRMNRKAVANAKPQTKQSKRAIVIHRNPRTGARVSIYQPV